MYALRYRVYELLFTRRMHCEPRIFIQACKGCNWLYLPSLAKRGLRQPGAAVVPAHSPMPRLILFSETLTLPQAGLLGCNWLYLLDLAKRRVLQPGAAIIPASAMLFCVGIEALTGTVSGFDFSGLNTYRRANENHWSYRVAARSGI